ncbi:hypothetical protein [Streptomyces sp. NBC_00083]|uniref:hypothetical protein n=1 Tax=Streptomyces sp. NBC_00083 TaxID=2975647 RepID=UPI002251470F|nr:hypothetical protein [Streptomyces sp. NBC_00083]MCX5384090.1 hypothetical protein [Streptomyces sp. NBC_00083]
MSKKQTRQNRGARTGGHDRSANPETNEQPKTSSPDAPERAHPMSEVSHKHPRKFGHN